MSKRVLTGDPVRDNTYYRWYAGNHCFPKCTPKNVGIVNQKSVQCLYVNYQKVISILCIVYEQNTKFVIYRKRYIVEISIGNHFTRKENCMNKEYEEN